MAVEVYTNAVNGLFDLAAELPSFQDDELAKQTRNLELIGSVSEVLGLERAADGPFCLTANRQWLAWNIESGARPQGGSGAAWRCPSGVTSCSRVPTRTRL